MLFDSSIILVFHYLYRGVITQFCVHVKSVDFRHTIRDFCLAIWRNFATAYSTHVTGKKRWITKVLVVARFLIELVISDFLGYILGDMPNRLGAALAAG